MITWHGTESFEGVPVIKMDHKEYMKVKHWKKQTNNKTNKAMLRLSS